MGETAGGPEPLTRLVEVARGLSGFLDLDRLLPAILDGVIGLARAERGAVLLRDDTGGLVVRAVRDGRGRDLDSGRFTLTQSIVSEAASSGQTVLIDDASEMDVYRQRQSVLSLSLRTILCAPLVGPQGVIGILYVDSHLASHRFTPEDRLLIEAFAAVATVALESVRLHEASRERDRMALELDLAARIQRSFLPAAFPSVAGYVGAARTEPAGQVGGDFYDFIELPDGRTAVFVVDVSGKGVPAAIAMARFVSQIRSRAARGPDVAAILTAVNRDAFARSGGEGFVTVGAAVFEPGSGQVDLYRCGHPQPILIQDGVAREIEVEGTPPVGIVEDLAPRPRRIEVRPGDVLLLYSDGALDARDVRGDLFGADRLREAAARGGAIPREVIGSVVRRVDGFAIGGRRADDLTLVAVARVGT